MLLLLIGLLGGTVGTVLLCTLSISNFDRITGRTHFRPQAFRPGSPFHHRRRPQRPRWWRKKKRVSRHFDCNAPLAVDYFAAPPCFCWSSIMS